MHNRGVKSSNKKNPWDKSFRNEKTTHSNYNLKRSEDKFKEAFVKHQEAAKKYVKDYESSSEEEEDLKAVNVIG